MRLSEKLRSRKWASLGRISSDFGGGNPRYSVRPLKYSTTRLEFLRTRKRVANTHTRTGSNHHSCSFSSSVTIPSLCSSVFRVPLCLLAMRPTFAQQQKWRGQRQPAPPELQPEEPRPQPRPRSRGLHRSEIRREASPRCLPRRRPEQRRRLRAGKCGRL